MAQGISIACKAREFRGCLAEVGPSIDGMIARSVATTIRNDMARVIALAEDGRGVEAMAALSEALAKAAKMRQGGPSLRTLLLDHALTCSRRADSASATDAYDTARENEVEARAFIFAAENSLAEAIAHYEARPRGLRVYRDDAQRAVAALRRFSERLRRGEL